MNVLPQASSDYISPSHCRKFCSYSPSSLRNWADTGKIRYIKALSGIPEAVTPTRSTICYARVSFSNQRNDLTRQISFLTAQYPQATIIAGIGSGLNYNRRELQQLLAQVSEGTVGKVVVTYRDRLCRYGIELIEWILRENNVELLVLMQEEIQTDTNEFSRDILDICNYFVAKYNGKKSAKYRALRKNLENQNHQTQSIKEIKIENQTSDLCDKSPLQ